ncbi:MAG: OsmC family protein [Chitinophagales bacterium]|nr:OsmC family protein [Chitinophagales bacterium]
MKVTLKRIDQDFNFEISNEDGLSVVTDGAPSIGGHNKGMRPMQMVLSALASCSAIDVVHLLRKQRQEAEDLKVIVEAQRETGNIANLFTDIHVHFQLKGDLVEKKVARAVDTSLEKLCSVKMILEKTANITWSYEIVM